MIDDLTQKEEYLKGLLKEKTLSKSNIKRITNMLEKSTLSFIGKVEISHSIHGTIMLPPECFPFIEEALRKGIKLYSDRIEECNQKLSKIEIHL